VTTRGGKVSARRLPVPLLAAQFERRVEDLDRPLGMLGPHQARDPDRRGRDHLDVDAGSRECLEHRGGDSWMGPHTSTDERDRRDVVVCDHRYRPELGDELLGHFETALEVRAGTVKEMSVVPWCDVF